MASNPTLSPEQPATGIAMPNTRPELRQATGSALPLGRACLIFMVVHLAVVSVAVLLFAAS
jgi:hypothetical protein